MNHLGRDKPLCGATGASHMVTLVYADVDCTTCRPYKWVNAEIGKKMIRRQKLRLKKGSKK